MSSLLISVVSIVVGSATRRVRRAVRAAGVECETVRSRRMTARVKGVGGRFNGYEGWGGLGCGDEKLVAGRRGRAGGLCGNGGTDGADTGGAVTRLSCPKGGGEGVLAVR